MHPSHLYRYGFDPTGKNPDNFIQHEIKYLKDQRFRAVVPYQNPFFAESFQMVDALTNRLLVHNVDYVFAELHQELSLELGREVYQIALVINREVSHQVKISYQCVGGEYSLNSHALEDLLAKDTNTHFSRSFYDIVQRPKEFTPSPHLHDLGDLEGLEVVTYQLECLRNALLWADAKTIESLMLHAQQTLDALMAKLLNRVHNEYLSLLIKYKSNFTKIFAGLGNIVNMGIASAEDGRQIYGGHRHQQNTHEDKYLVTEALVAYKDMLYSTMVSMQDTHLGQSYGANTQPSLQALTDMPAGSSVVMESLRYIKNQKQDFDPVVYPSDTNQQTRWVIHKLSNKPEQSGAVLMAFDMTTGDLYIGDLQVSRTQIKTLAWSRILNEKDTEGFLDDLIKHMNNHSGAHKPTKTQIGLSDVENLSLASKEDVVCRKPVRKYISYDNLLLFSKVFLTGEKNDEDVEEDIENPSVLEKYQTIFAPCGPCGGYKTQTLTIEKEVEKEVIKKVCDEADKLLAKFCQDGNEMGIYTDGECGTKIEIITEEAEHCAISAPPPPPAPAPAPVMVDRFSMGWYRPRFDLSDSQSAYYELAGTPSNDVIFFNPIMNESSRSSYHNGELGQFKHPLAAKYFNLMPRSNTELKISSVDLTGASYQAPKDNYPINRINNGGMAFGVDEGEWDPEITVKVEPGIYPPKAGNYLCVNEEDHFFYLTEFNFTEEQARVMQKILIKRVENMLCINQHTGNGFAGTIQGSQLYFEATYESLTEEGFLDTELQDISGVSSITREEFDIIGTVPNDYRLHQTAYPGCMFTFPVGDVRICFYKGDILLGYLPYAQYFNYRKWTVPLNEVNLENGDRFILVRYHGRWFNNPDEERQIPNRELGYTNPDFIRKLAPVKGLITGNLWNQL